MLSILWYSSYLLLHDKLSPTKQLNLTHIYYLTFLWVRSLGTAQWGPVSGTNKAAIEVSARAGISSVGSIGERVTSRLACLVAECSLLQL